MAAQARLQNDRAGRRDEANIAVIAGKHQPVPDDQRRSQVTSAAVDVGSDVRVGDVAGAGGIDRDGRAVAAAGDPDQRTIVLRGGNAAVFHTAAGPEDFAISRGIGNNSLAVHDQLLFPLVVDEHRHGVLEPIFTRRFPANLAAGSINRGDERSFVVVARENHKIAPEDRRRDHTPIRREGSEWPLPEDLSVVGAKAIRPGESKKAKTVLPSVAHVPEA